MSHDLACPNCGLLLRVSAALLGRAVTCGGCRHRFVARVPAAAAPVPRTGCPICGNPLAVETGCGECGYRPTNPSAPAHSNVGPLICPNSACGVANAPGDRFCQRCTTPLPVLVGQVLAGRYRLTRSLAAGGFGLVYLANDSLTNRPLAVKEMLAPEPSEFATRLTFFRREAEILHTLRHLSAVPRLEAFIEDGSAAFLVMEYIPGRTLLEELSHRGRPFPLPLVREWGQRILEVLGEMHRRSPPWIHRDLKPENVMLLPDGRSIKLIDFGTARALDTVEPSVRSAPRTQVFTQGYAAPEQMLGRPEARSDLYALAGTLLHLATGQPPDGERSHRELRRSLDTPTGVWPSEDAWFYELLAANLADEVHDRCDSAEEMRLDLQHGRVTRERRCRQCGEANAMRVPFCRRCAGVLTATGPACSACGRANPLSCRFCISCGHRYR